MFDNAADSFQVSPQQEQLWALEPEGPVDRVQAVVRMVGRVDHAALADALRRSVQRHESLRTTFARQSGLRVPVQVVGGARDPELRTASLDATRREALIGAELEAPFDLASGPLLRALLISEGDERHDLVLTVSALCADTASLVILVQELVVALGVAAELVEDPLQYADFSAWQRELLASQDDEARAAGAHWQSIAQAGDPVLPFTRTGDRSARVQTMRVPTGENLAPRLRTAAERAGADTAAMVQAAWHAALGRFTGESEAVVGVLADARRHADLAGAVGAFARPVPIRVGTGEETTFAELVAETARRREEALAWQDYAPVDAPRPAIGFVAGPAYRAETGDVTVALEELTAAGAFSLWLTCLAGEDDLRLQFGFDPDVHRAEDVARLGHAVSRLLDAASTDAAARIGEVDVLDPDERTRVLSTFNDTAAPVPAQAVHELFAAHAAAAPARPAVLDARGEITYGELATRAAQLAARLRREGVGPDVCVGLCTDRSSDMVVGVLGILMAGGAYVPLHDEHPVARLRHQLETVEARILVTQEALLDGLPDVDRVICLDRDRDALAAEPIDDPAPVAADRLAYVIYTSGSTGTPKGVSVTHGNVVNYATAIATRLGLGDTPARFGMVTAISTDLGNTALFGALCSGGTLVLVDADAAADPGAFARRLETAGVDVLKITPSHIGALLAGGDARVLPRRWLVLGGERAPWDLITRVRGLSTCQILNHYGPTETTVGSCTYLVGDGPGEYAPASVPIGQPLANTRCYVLDDRRQPVPIGVTGRLYIGGAGVARGYAGAPELTAERFLVDPFAGSGAGRMYDTGDLARWLPDGSLEFGGRVDEQVKIRGYRVEPGEVEAALRNHPHVREAVAVVQDAATGEARLVAYAAVEGVTTVPELQAHMAEWLPEFMLPSAVAILDALPRTPSGKIDKLALPEPDETAEEDAAQYVPPRTPMEEGVAAIWAHVLGLPRVGANDDFFALGGHSLLATQVVAHVRSDYAVDLPLHSLFAYPTVSSLAAEIVAMMGSSEEEETARLMAELEALSDEEAERLLAGEQPEA